MGIGCLNELYGLTVVQFILTRLSCNSGEQARITNDYNITPGDSHSLSDIIAWWPIDKWAGKEAGNRQIVTNLAPILTVIGLPFPAESCSPLISITRECLKQRDGCLVADTFLTHFDADIIQVYE